jgi:hypothetical protein
VPLTERLAHLVDSVSMPAMTFTTDGALAGANAAAKNVPGLFGNLNGPGFDEARAIALRDGQAALKMESSRVTLHRVGTGATTALVALIDRVITPQPAPKPAPVIIEPAEPLAAHPPAEMPAAASVAAEMETAPAFAVPPPAQAAPLTAAVNEAPEQKPSAETLADVLPTDLFGSAFDDQAETDAPAPQASKLRQSL